MRFDIFDEIWLSVGKTFFNLIRSSNSDATHMDQVSAKKMPKNRNDRLSELH